MIAMIYMYIHTSIVGQHHKCCSFLPISGVGLFPNFTIWAFHTFGFVDDYASKSKVMVPSFNIKVVL